MRVHIFLGVPCVVKIRSHRVFKGYQGILLIRVAGGFTVALPECLLWIPEFGVTSDGGSKVKIGQGIDASSFVVPIDLLNKFSLGTQFGG